MLSRAHLIAFPLRLKGQPRPAFPTPHAHNFIARVCDAVTAFLPWRRRVQSKENGIQYAGFSGPGRPADAKQLPIGNGGMSEIDAELANERVDVAPFNF